MPRRQGSSESTRPLTDDGRRRREHDRGRGHHHERHRRDDRRRRRRHDEVSWARKQQEHSLQDGILTPGLEGIMDAAHLGENPFATPAPPPAYEDRRIRASPVEQIEKDFGLAPLGPDPHSGHADGADPEKQQTKTELSKWERWLGPWVYIVPIFTATALLFAATCSADSWRVKVNVVRVDLPNDVFARLLATAKSLGKTSTGQKAEDGVEARGVRFISAGYLSVGFWGWCVSRPDQSEFACSPTNAWYTMDELLETASITNRIPVRAFHDGLIHGQVVYGPAMVLAMMATVPAGIHIWRRLIRNKRNIEAGIALHGTLFAAAVLSLIAFAVSKALKMRLDRKIGLPARAGSVPAMAGVASLLLFLGLAGSVIPVIYRRVKRQQEILGSWDDVQVAQATPLPTSRFRRNFSLGRKGTWRSFRPRTFFGRSYDDDDDDRGGGGGRRRRGRYGRGRGGRY